MPPVALRTPLAYLVRPPKQLSVHITGHQTMNGTMPEQRTIARRSAPPAAVKSPRDGSTVEFRRTKSNVAPFRLDPKNVTVLDRQLSRILKRERDAAVARSSRRQEELEQDSSIHDDEELEHHWRRRLLRFLHHHHVHTVMTLLLILDLVTVVISLELQIQVSARESQAKEACLMAYETGAAVPEYFLDSPTCNPTGLHVCDVSHQAPYHAVHGLHVAEVALAYVSICILTLFLAENVLMMGAIGWYFFQHFFFVLDVVVVSVSLGLELVAVASAHMGLVVGNILIVARMWRFFRVAHGIYFLDHSSEAAHVTIPADEDGTHETEGSNPNDLYRSDGANMGVGVDGKLRAGSCPPIDDRGSEEKSPASSSDAASV